MNKTAERSIIFFRFFKISFGQEYISLYIQIESSYFK